ncbi:FtsX-like permease family protein [Metabacillus idriensis]|uniref:FtsX-like permease family protein n=1 Tax=Metabacillus idriensis TaxID=324768 RepID=UPI0017481C70|nr:ABC transporter permease [Metabacillus idriensis]
MNINQLIFQNLKKNLKNYYLYIFALIFSVALYFAFVTLQYDPSMEQVEGSIKGGAAVRSASILLVAIVTIFLLYANNIFIKRRSKEIGLFQLIGMTKNKIFRILTAENFLLYFGSLILGILTGFSVSKLIMMILFKITGVDEVAALHFSMQAFLQTLAVFFVIYLLIMLMNYLFIKRQSILALFRVLSSAEEKVKKMSFFEIAIGILGMILIAAGYFVSSRLFGGDFKTMPALFGAMIFILGSVILGTYLFYKGSVSFIFHMIRKKKDGYLKVGEVLSLSSIMFRMKSNALLLTIITTVSALAIGLLSLSYISYYSAEKTAQNQVPADFSITDDQSAERFKKALEADDIAFKEEKIEIVMADVNVKDILNTNLDEMNFDPNKMTLPVINEKSVKGKDLSKNEIVFTGYSDLLQKFMPMNNSGNIELIGKTKTIPQTYLGLEKDYPISWYFTNGGLPAAIVDDSVFKQLKKDINPEIQQPASTYIGIDIAKQEEKEANTLFKELKLNENAPNDSQLEISSSQKKNMGLVMFIVGFLGLSFLVTSGCILYFKQMGESEEEKPNYTILRKLGFTQGDLLKGIQAKQLFSFGIPLVIGLLHSYFAVQSGWFLFGAEVWSPMIIVMVLYTGLYSIFGVLSVLYYKKVIKEAL